MEEVQQEMMLKFQMFEQQIQIISQQLQAVEQTIVELGQLNLGLDELIGKKDSEIKAPVGRGIYIKAKLISEDLMVDIGNRNFVKKSIPETKEILKNQIVKLEEIREQLEGEMEKINEELTKTFMESQGHSHSHGECSCGHCSDDECDCGDECECK